MIFTSLQVGMLKGVYHFALLNVDGDDSNQASQKRRGTFNIGERSEKTSQLNADDNVMTNNSMHLNRI